MTRTAWKLLSFRFLIAQCNPFDFLLFYLEIYQWRKRIPSEAESDFEGNFIVFEEFCFFGVDFFQNVKSHRVFGSADWVHQQLEDLKRGKCYKNILQISTREFSWLMTFWMRSHISIRGCVRPVRSVCHRQIYFLRNRLSLNQILSGTYNNAIWITSK